MTDDGHGFEPRHSAPNRDSASGWGLYLVDQLADRWGVTNTHGTSVWFELDRRAGLGGDGSGAEANGLYDVAKRQ